MCSSTIQQLAALGVVLLVTGCVTQREQVQVRQPISIDGSSTVYPITEAIATDYRQAQDDPVDINVSFSGTGGGFEKFCAGETDINDASRPILETEMAACDAAGVRFLELPIAFDALTVVVNQQNTWAEEMVVNARYQPLSRPLFIYVNLASAQTNPVLAELPRKTKRF